MNDGHDDGYAMYLCRTLLCAYVHSTSSGAGADPVVDSPGSQELDNEQVPEHEKRKMRKEAREALKWRDLSAEKWSPSMPKG